MTPSRKREPSGDGKAKANRKPPVSLAPLDFERALKGLLETPVPDESTRAKPRPKAKRKPKRK